MSIEPKYYIPIIPMLLVNGSEGIGTGYSTNIPCYNPDDIIANLKRLIDSDGTLEQLPMTPWYRGFKGTIISESENKYITTGVVKRINNTTLEITELPIGKWTQTFKEFLETLIETNDIIDYKNNCDDAIINFKIVMQKSVLDNLSNDDIIKKLKLTSTINTSNMHVFDADSRIRKISCPEEIIYRFYQIRKEHYIKRKKYLLDKLSTDLNLLDSKIRFIQAVISEKIIVFNKKKDFIVKQIMEYPESFIKINDNYDYLLELKLSNFTLEKINEYLSKQKQFREEVDILSKTSINTMWNKELMDLEF